MIAATALLASKPVPLRLPECFKAPVQPGLRAVPETRTSVPTTGKPLGYVAGGPGFEPRLTESESLPRAHDER
jgi:hypothetical protein